MTTSINEALTLTQNPVIELELFTISISREGCGMSRRVFLGAPGLFRFRTCVFCLLRSALSRHLSAFPWIELRTSLDTSILSFLSRSSAGAVVKLLACGARGPGFDSRSRSYDFRDWLSPASKWRYGWKIAKATNIIKQPTNQSFLSKENTLTVWRKQHDAVNKLLTDHAGNSFVLLVNIAEIVNSMETVLYKKNIN